MLIVGEDAVHPLTVRKHRKKMEREKSGSTNFFFIGASFCDARRSSEKTLNN
jgi:hypothetical protein